ncbi:MAG TPA: Crp/Fnr family transcriptional regulator [Rhizomicrobium sp.]|jgi:CRP-like cAMP-binding protein|nr:Crp/Fnr family transcriptional regulator [Rhizomicrobium sp.]
MSPDDLALLERDLERVPLRQGQILEAPNRPIEHVYFVENGVVSVVVVNANDHRIEVGVIGLDGVTGLPVIMGDDRSTNSTYMQIAGDGQRISVAAFRAAMTSSPSLYALLLRFARSFMTQTAHTALANGRAKLDERLARWLLMAHDRMDGNAVPLTHEFLAVMLGVRRAGVTVALKTFEQQGLVTTRRGELTVVSRDGLEKTANSFYGVPEAELRRLIGEQL